MKPDNHQDHTKRMADRLREHSVPYKEGAWERFMEVELEHGSRVTKTKRFVLWPYFSAAAAILVFMTVLLLQDKELKQAPILSGNKEKDVESLKEPALANADGKEKTSEINNIGGTAIGGVATKESISRETQEELITERSIAFHETNPKQEIISLMEKNHIETLSLEADKFGKSEVVSIGIANQEKNSLVDIAQVSPEKKSHLDKTIESPFEVDRIASVSAKLAALTNESSNSLLVNESSKKWSVGLEVSPNMSSNKQVNMGGGLAFSYEISPKVSLSTGLSYVQLNADNDPYSGTNPPSQNPSEGPGPSHIMTNAKSKDLRMVHTNLVGLDIPLNLNYQVSKNFYATAGVSVFNIINEDRTNKFMNREVELFYTNNGSSINNKTPEPAIREFFSEEAANKKSYEPTHLNGFFNFSVGYSIPVTKKIGLSFEPFFKIPMRFMPEDNLNFKNGGIKVVTSF